jgi:hypothetical protein
MGTSHLLVLTSQLAVFPLKLANLRLVGVALDRREDAVDFRGEVGGVCHGFVSGADLRCETVNIPLRHTGQYRKCQIGIFLLLGSDRCDHYGNNPSLHDAWFGLAEVERAMDWVAGIGHKPQLAVVLDERLNSRLDLAMFVGPHDNNALTWGRFCVAE